MADKHTKGPWNLVGPTGDRKAILIEQPGDGWHRLAVEVDSDDCDYAMAEANARLICAAPDLLSACEAMLAAQEVPGLYQEMAAEAAALKLMAAAVAKAKGGVA